MQEQTEGYNKRWTINEIKINEKGKSERAFSTKQGVKNIIICHNQTKLQSKTRLFKKNIEKNKTKKQINLIARTNWKCNNSLKITDRR